MQKIEVQRRDTHRHGREVAVELSGLRGVVMMYVVELPPEI